MELSVILPVHNNGKRAAATAAGVLGLSGVDCELLIVDDGSDDDAHEIMRSLQNTRVRLLRLPRHLGVSAARNAGMHDARGEFVLFVDAGDTLMPDGLLELLRAMNSHDLGVGGYKQDITEDLTAMDALGESPFPDGTMTIPAPRGTHARDGFPDLLQTMLRGDLLHPVGNKLYRRTVTASVRFDETVLHCLEDELFNLAALAHAESVVLTSEPLVLINTADPESLSRRYDDDRLHNLGKIAKAYDKLLRRLGCAPESAAGREVDKQLMLHCLAFLANLKKALAFAHPSETMYAVEEMLLDPTFALAAKRLDLRREMLVASVNFAARHAFPLLRRRSFIRAEHGSFLEHFAYILEGLSSWTINDFAPHIEPALRAGAMPEDAAILEARLWSEFDV